MERIDLYTILTITGAKLDRISKVFRFHISKEILLHRSKKLLSYLKRDAIILHYLVKVENKNATDLNAAHYELSPCFSLYLTLSTN